MARKVKLASRIDRWLASSIDGLMALMTVLSIILAAPIINNLDAVKFILLLMLLIFSLIQACLLASSGQTFGKKVMKIRIIRVDTGRNGGLITNVLIRFVVGVVLLGTIPFYTAMDTVFIWREDKRCIHDLIAGTCVVDV